jgi:hypothetical protein
MDKRYLNRYFVSKVAHKTCTQDPGGRMELFAVKIDGQDCCQVVDNESMHIVGYLGKGEKGF